MLTDRPRALTWKVDLPGGQTRLREAVLYVAQECREAKHFGLIKLNKILWRADFEAFASRGQPVTGRQYQRLRLGPAPVEMVPVLNDLQARGHLTLERRAVIDFDEQRPVAHVEPILRFFSQDDLAYLNESIKYFWEWTGRITSEDSHGVAWSVHNNGDALPYESAYLSDEKLTDWQSARFSVLARQKGWQSR